MSNQQILTKAIEKAIDGGFWQLGKNEVKSRYGFLRDKQKTVEEVYVIEYKGSENQLIRELAFETIIFNHDFAKALWGEDIRIVGETPGAMTQEERPLAWQWHLQQMVIADDPIKYLGDNL